MRTVLLFPIALLLLIACKPQKGPLEFKDSTLPFEGNALIQGKAPLSFKSLHEFILKPKCLSCHSELLGRAEPEFDPINFDTYETTMEKKFIPLLIKGHPKKSRLWEEVDNGNMPIKERLHQKEIDFIAKWIRACAPNEEITELPKNCEEDDDDDDDDDDDFDDDIEDDFDNDEF